MSEPIQIMRLSEVIAMTQLSKTTLWNRTKQGLFPDSFKLGGKCSGFFKHEVIATINAMSAGATDIQLRALINKLQEQRQERAGEFLDQLAA